MHYKTNFLGPQTWRSIIAWLAAFASPLAASAQPATMTMTLVSHPFAGEGDLARLGAVVGEMVTVQWAGRGQRRVVPSTTVCADSACGAQSARGAGAQGALIGRVHRLGDKLTLTAYWVRADGVVVATAMTTAKDESDLPEAARRLATDLEGASPTQPAAIAAPTLPVGNAPAQAPAPLPAQAPAPLPAPAPVPAPAPPPPPAIYAPAAAPPPTDSYPPSYAPAPPAAAAGAATGAGRSYHSSFPVLRIGYFHPLSTSFPKADSLSGELSIAFAHGPFLIEPRIAFRRSFHSEDEWYAEVPMDLGFFVRFGQADVYPILGGGVGLHYLAMQRIETYTVGSVIYARHRSEVEGSVFGFGGFARAGLGFQMSNRATMFITGDVDATAGEVFGRSPHWAAVLNVGFGFGGWVL